MKYLTLTVLFIASLFLLFSCGASSDISGEYVCIQHLSDDMVGELSLDFQKDGTVMMNPVQMEGEYTVEGDTVTVSLEAFDLTFVKDGNKLSSPDNSVVYEKK